jgi:hypothetical protein
MRCPGKGIRVPLSEALDYLRENPLLVPLTLIVLIFFRSYIETLGEDAAHATSGFFRRRKKPGNADE